MINPGTKYSEDFEVIEAIGLGLAAFTEGRAIVTSGNLASAANTVNYIHENTPPRQQFTRTTMEFKISAHHPRIGIGTQQFWFRLSFEHNGNDLRNAQIVVLEDKSSRMTTSEFSIQFNGQPYSLPQAAVAEIVFQISGKWDPVGLGVASFWGELFIKADGSTRATIGSEQDWVWFDGFYGLRREQLSQAARPPVSVPQPPPARATGGKPTLRRNSRGPAVRELQTALNKWLAAQRRTLLAVEGVFGSRTEQAVKAFQSAKGLTVDGVVGPKTWGHLLSA